MLQRKSILYSLFSVINNFKMLWEVFHDLLLILNRLKLWLFFPNILTSIKLCQSAKLYNRKWFSLVFYLLIYCIINLKDRNVKNDTPVSASILQLSLWMKLMELRWTDIYTLYADNLIHGVRLQMDKRDRLTDTFCVATLFWKKLKDFDFVWNRHWWHGTLNFEFSRVSIKLTYLWWHNFRPKQAQIWSY